MGAGAGLQPSSGGTKGRSRPMPVGPREGKPAPAVTPQQMQAGQERLQASGKGGSSAVQPTAPTTQPTPPAAQAEPTLTPSQLMGVINSMGGKGGMGYGYQPPMQQSNPYAAGAKGMGYQPRPMYGGYGMQSPYVNMGGKGGMGYQPRPMYGGYGMQSPYVNMGGMGGKGGYYR